MKRILTILCLVSLLASVISCSSKEEKAAALIKERMFQTLYDFDSYQPITTVVDTGFYSPFIDTKIKQEAHKVAAVRNEYDEIQEEIDDGLRELKTYGYLYSRSEIQKRKKELEEKLDNLRMKAAEHDSLYDALCELVFDCSSEPIGWAAYHKYRCKTKGGSASIGEKIYYFDNKMKAITNTVDLMDDEDGTYDVITNVLTSDERGKEHLLHFSRVMPKNNVVE